MKTLAIACLAAGCWSSAPSPATVPAQPDEAVPVIGWSAEQRRFTATGLPAVAADGTVIVLAHISDDSARGNPNLTLEARDRADKVVDQLLVVDANEGDALVEDTVALAARIGKAQRWVHDQAMKRHLAPLVETVVEEGAPSGSNHVANGGGLTVDWLPGVFELRRDGKVLASQQTPGAWLSHRTDRCENPAYLAAAWVDRARPIALVKIGFRGNDSCWEPDSQEHVVAW